MSRLAKGAMAILIPALAFCACSTKAPALKPTASSTVAGEPGDSRPGASEYFAMVQALSDWVNSKKFSPVFYSDPTGKIVESPDKTPMHLPAHFRSPTAAEVEKMGPLWPNVPPKNNAAYHFGKAILGSLDEEKSPAGSASSSQPYAGDIDALAKWIDGRRSELGEMEEGLKQDACSVPWCIEEETGGPQLPLRFLTGLRQIARDLTDEGFVEELKGNPDRAAGYYLECIRLGGKFRNGTVIEWLEGVAVQGIGLRPLESLIANATLSDETLRRVIATFREAELPQDAPARSLAAELTVAEAQLALAKAPYRDDPKMLHYVQQARALRNFSAGKRLDQLLQKQWLQAAFENELKDSVDNEGKEILPRTLGELGRLNVRLRATQIRAAIALYQKAQGRLPDSLDALCPEILPSVPMDPFSGKPMRYERTPDGWKTWSVGPGNVDHGGVIRHANSPDEETQMDIVFTANVLSNEERLSRGAIKTLPAQSEKPK
jgi:hypothetical protein